MKILRKVRYWIVRIVLSLLGILLGGILLGGIGAMCCMAFSHAIRERKIDPTSNAVGFIVMPMALLMTLVMTLVGMLGGGKLVEHLYKKVENGSAGKTEKKLEAADPMPQDEFPGVP